MIELLAFISVIYYFFWFVASSFFFAAWQKSAAAGWWYFITVLLLLNVFWSPASAATSQTTLTVYISCNNENWEHSTRCTAPVDWFMVEENGESYGALSSGVTFQQRNISNELGVRLQRFTMEEVLWYVTDRGVVFADNDTQALSIYLTRL